MSDQSEVVDLIVRWEDARKQGRELTPEELCRDCPELIPEFKRSLAKGLSALHSTEEHLADSSIKLPLPDAHAVAEAAPRWRAVGERAFQPLHFHARGGMGEVYVAEDSELQRKVALKRMQEPFVRDPRSRQEFVREAEITGLLEHPGVVPVYGLVQDGDGKPCYAMRFVQGESLKEAIERFHRRGQGENKEVSVSLSPRSSVSGSFDSLEFRQLLTRFIAVCNTIAYAHSRGVIHRDLKPANIILGKYGETIVLDWGLARRVDRDETARASGEETVRPTLAGDSTQTRRGDFKGTVNYMSPEQACGLWDRVGPASDVFSLGATLYQMLVGQPPYAGPEALKAAERGEFAAPRQVNTKVPLALDAICRKALAAKPEDRYASPLALAGDLEKWLGDEAVSALRDSLPASFGRWARKHRTFVTSAAAVLLVLTAASLAGALVVGGLNRELHDSNTSLDAARRDAQANEQRALAATERRRAALDDATSELLDLFLSKQPQDLDARQKEFLGKMVNYYEEFANEQGADDMTRAGVAAANNRIGRIQDKLDQTAGAERAFRRAVELYRQLVADQPSNREYRARLAGSLNDLGNLIHRAGGRLQEAEKAHREAISVWTDSDSEAPRDPQERLGLASGYLNLATELEQLNRMQEAEETYRKGITLLRPLPAEKNLAQRRTLSKGLYNLGIMLSTSRPRDAEEPIQEAIETTEKLIAEFPDLHDERHLQSNCYLLRGRLAASGGNEELAKADFQKALPILSKLVADFPAVPHYRESLATCHHFLGSIHKHAGRLEDAEQAYQKAIDLTKQLVDNNPLVFGYRRGLIIYKRTLGDLLEGSKRLQEAEKIYRETVADASDLAKKLAPGEYTVEDALGLGGTAFFLGNLLLKSGRDEESLEWFTLTIKTFDPFLAQKSHVNARFYPYMALRGRLKS
jgi:serine/threonine-protein kinase